MERRRTNGHTILFLQATDSVSRVFSEYKDVDACWYGMCEMFEETYKRKASVSEVSYDINDVVEYFKIFTEILLMVYDEDLGHYMPHESDWIWKKLEEYGANTPDATSVSKSGASSQPAAATAMDEDVEFEEDWE